MRHYSGTLVAFAALLFIVATNCASPELPRVESNPRHAATSPAEQVSRVSPAPSSFVRYPATRKVELVEDYHGVSVADPYRWLEEGEAEATRRWIEDENRVTRAYLDGIPERPHIAERLTTLWNYERFGIPEAFSGRFFFTKNDGLQNQPVLYVSEGRDASPRLLFDPNAEAPDGSVALQFWSPSSDGKFLAYGITSGGSDWTEIRVRDVSTGADFPERLHWIKFSDAAWTKDGRGFFYARFPEPRSDAPAQTTNYFHKLYYHRLGTTQAEDVVVYERPDQKQWMFDPQVTGDGRYLIVTISKSTDQSRSIWYADLSRQGAPHIKPTELISNFDAEYDFIGNSGSRLWFKTTLRAPRGRVIAIDLKHPRESNWQEIVPEGSDVLQEVHWVGNRLISTYLKDAHTEVRVSDLRGNFLHTVTLPGIGTVHGFTGQETDAETFFSFASFTTPSVVYRYDPQANLARVFRTPQLAFEPGRFQTEQLFVASQDGSRVPVFLSRRKGAVPSGATPTYLYGYGGFDISLTPAFDPAALAWMEMGGIYAVANLRGGGEYGESWHEAGERRKKQKVFDDFMAVARSLVTSGLTRPDKLAIGGRSNGGLLVGACVTQHPELFAAALPAVGVLDMLRYQRFTIGWAWQDEYGTSDDPDDFKTLFAYSPLHNIKPGGHYPATLVTASDHDDRVVPAHSFKFAATLQAAQAASAPILIRIETSAGHGAATPTAKLIDEQADRWAFLVRVLNFTPWKEGIDERPSSVTER